MEVITEQVQLTSSLKLRAPDGSLLEIDAIALTLNQKQNEISECSLIFEVSPELYQQIETQALFNLKPAVRSPHQGGDFLPEFSIRIETILKPSLLPDLLSNATDGSGALAYLLHLSQTQLEHLLLATENWICLSVRQSQPFGEVGFKTFWNYIKPSITDQSSASGEQVAKGFSDFFQDWTEASLMALSQETIDEILNDMTCLFEEWVSKNWLENEQEVKPGKMFEALVKFFESEDWLTVAVEGETALQIAFQGENGQWTCYAKVNEEREEFVFYSLCPVNASESRRQAMAEFLTRANYGLTIGNFEMDFEHGVIHYKTSIDVENDRLSVALIRQLVYANVMIMDQYLPGIMAVIYGNALPAEAIVQIEG